MSKVLGIIVAYGHPDVARKCIRHASNQDHRDIDWILWSNGGLAGLGAVPSGIRFHESENILWTPALNRAIEIYLKPEHTHIFYMNHDIYLPTSAVRRLVDYLDSIPGAGAVGPVGSSLGGLQDYVSNKELYEIQKRHRATYLMGAIQLMKREVWDTVGPFDETMPLGGDDFDYSIRMKEAGYSLWTTSDVYVEHVGHVTGQSPEWHDHGGRSWTRFNEKYDMYYATEAEAIGSLWNSSYNEKYPLGTGISEEEKVRRGIKNAF